MTGEIINAPSAETSIVGVNPILPMIQAMVERGITAESAAAMEKMTDLFLKMEAVNARKAFVEAFRALQADIPSIQAQRIIPNNDGTARSRFAALEDIMGALSPHLNKHGFTVNFDSKHEDANGKSRVVAICVVTHVCGHSESREFACRTSPPPKSSEAQADGATFTYAKRMALCAMFNLTIDKDSDARAVGDLISLDMAADLDRRLTALGADVGAFLRIAGAEALVDIRENDYPALDRMLTARERAKH